MSPYTYKYSKPAHYIRHRTQLRKKTVSSTKRLMAQTIFIHKIYLPLVVKGPSLNVFRKIMSSNTNCILYNTGGCSPPFHVSVGYKFYIQLALPISPEIMEGFWCSRCLNDRIEVPDMMRLFAGGATTPLVVKIWTKQP